MINNKGRSREVQRRALALLTGVLCASTSSIYAQDAADEEEEIFELSPFTVEGSENVGYRATSSLAGTRFRTDLSDIGSSISVLTEEMLEDVGGVDNETVLTYAVNTEVGGPRGNYSGGVTGGSVARENGLFGNPNANTRVRGLNRADNTRNYFSSGIPWDGYVVDRVDLLRGPNSILFGLGSPSGVINATTKGANMGGTDGEVQVSFDKFGSIRTNLKYNKVLVEDKLAVFAGVLNDDQKFRQKPAYEEDRRLYVAGLWRPDFMNSDSSMFEVTANFESGSITSNRPRTLTPGDRITPFWNPITERDADGNFVPFTAATYSGRPGGLGGRTVNHLNDTDGFLDRNEGNNYNGLTTPIFMDGPAFQVNSNNPYQVFRERTFAFGAYDETGVLVYDGEGGNIYGDNNRSQGMDGTRAWSSNTGQYGAGGSFWEDATISDVGIFDFYNNLLDGPNKQENTDWDAYEASISHTFLDGKIGYNLALYEENIERGSFGIFGWEYRLRMDINEQLANGAMDAGNAVSANPDVGRAYISEELRDSGTGNRETERSAYRAQLFAEYDFRDDNDGFLPNLLGSHRFTLLHSAEETTSDNRRMNLAMFGPDYYHQFGGENSNVSVKAYLSGDLRGLSSASGANVQRLNDFVLPYSGPVSIQAFDTTWTATGVDPTAVWPDPNDERTEAYDFQSANPANYRGWRDYTFNVVSALDDGRVAGMSNQDYLTTRADLSNLDISSNVAVWQGHLLNDAIVGLYGYREDTADSLSLRAADRVWTGGPDYSIDYPDLADVRPSAYNFTSPINPGDLVDERLETITRNWSGALHVNKLLGDNDPLPFNVSFYYNEGENAQPAAGRLDAYGLPLPPPQGSTEEYSILLSTKDGKYSFRATDYKTVVTNQNTTGDIGAMWALQQAIFVPTRSYGDFKEGNWDISSHPNPEYLENEILPAWEQFEIDLQEQFPDFIDAWVTGPWAPSHRRDTRASRPANHKFTEDAVSEGQEFEFMANPNENWRIAINASRTEAIRDKVPGQSFLDVSAFVDNAIMNTPVGEMPVWWSASPGVRVNIYPTYRGDYLKLLSLNGQIQPEVREWRANLITNYSFTDGKFKGLGLGGALRWEDKAAIDYLPSEENADLPDITNPVFDDGYETFDLWASYKLKLSDRIDYKVQLNIYNAFGDNELVPISTDPFGNANRFRIREGASWKISNTFSF
ncbi:TonB-dependent receptor [Pelagicoccus mobilis]|uniref:TonB-dependent receptor n=1 Tax=Pelagicoccus mobilis TaxID=415221 RepID=A0A934VRT6_9BACT|nr:TonB-dependent receptor [Pelagicoccus mobilis]MBK1879742.1 TonB-dependent receptor [Pelagicoccus mobilis]